jgi:hypothetical protein
MKRAYLTHRVLLPLPFFLAACGPATGDGTTPDKAQPKVAQQQIAAVGYFDLGAAFPAPPAIPARVNKEILTGVEVAGRPLVMECLVPPTHRGADKKTKVVVDATLAAGGVEHKITGENLTPAGVACIEGALKKWTAALPTLNAAAASGPVAAHVEYVHVVGVSPSVTLGVSAASDIAAAVRLALPGWNDCLAPWKSAAPSTLKATIKVTKPAGSPTPAETTPAEVTFEPGGDAVATCLKGKLTALKLKSPADESITIPYTFRFVHSGLGDALPALEPEVQFAQLDLVRARRAAEAAIALGDRGESAGVYDAAVKGYKARVKPEVTVKELKDKCAALLSADDRLVEAMKRQLGIETATQKLASEQKAKDASWAEAEAAATQQVVQAQKDAEAFTAQRKNDEGACPKER